MKKILYVPAEIKGEPFLERYADQNADWIPIPEPVCEIRFRELFQQLKKNGILPCDCLLVAASDRAIALAGMCQAVESNPAAESYPCKGTYSLVESYPCKGSYSLVESYPCKESHPPIEPNPSMEPSLAVLAYQNPRIPGQKYEKVRYLVQGFEEIGPKELERIWRRHHKIPWDILSTNRCNVREIGPKDFEDMHRLAWGTGVRENWDFRPGNDEKEYWSAYIRHMYEFYEYGLWLVFEKETGKLIGCAGLENPKDKGDEENQEKLEIQLKQENQEKLEIQKKQEKLKIRLKQEKQKQEQPKKLKIQEKQEQEQPKKDKPDSEKFCLELGYAILPEFRRQGYAYEVCSAILDYAGEVLACDRVICRIPKGNEASLALARKLGLEYSIPDIPNGICSKRDRFIDEDGNRD